MSTQVAYLGSLEGELDSELSRWLWLVKWLLLIPHIIILAILWMALLILTVAAFFAILFTGRYPRDIFNFNVGVLRWTWRVGFYSYSALGTDRYPPFSLKSADYPATLEVQYPEQLSRGLVLVKWWLLALPQSGIPQIKPTFLEIAPSGIPSNIIPHSKGVKCGLIRSNSPFSYSNHRPAKPKIPKPLVYAQVSPLGTSFATP